MAVCTTGAEWASESAYGPGPLLQIVPAILRRAVKDFAQTPPTAMGRATAADSASSEAKKEQQRTDRHRTPCFKGVRQTLLKITTGLMASRPLRRRLRWRRCRVFFPLCHSKSLNGRSAMSRHNLYKIQRIIAQESPYRRFRSHHSGQRSNPSKPILGVAFSSKTLGKS